MILLDTNVISEPLRATPAPAVIQWLDDQPLETLFLSAITVAELRSGVAAMAPGKRRDNLDQQLETQILPLFNGRILSFDLAVTKIYADRMAKAKTSGLTVGLSDGYIAAIAITHTMAVATRDKSPFTALAVPVIDPWGV